MPSNLSRLGVALALSLFAVSCGGPSEPGLAGERTVQAAMQSDDAVVATIGKKKITLAELDSKVMTSNMPVFQELYNARREALGALVAEALLDQEAAERGMTREELVDKEVTSLVTPVTDADITAFFQQNEARLGGQTLEQIGGQIRDFLVARNEQTARQSYLDRLKADADVALSLEPPRVPVTVASNERVRGPEDAPITIVEYSDFQ